MKQLIIFLFILVTFFLFVGKTNVYTYDSWIDAGNKSCDVVCKNADLQPVISGTYTNGYPFYVCAANVKGEGYRAGYNLQPEWADVCVVGWGSKELSVRQYKCLCK